MTGRIEPGEERQCIDTWVEPIRDDVDGLPSVRLEVEPTPGTNWWLSMRPCDARALARALTEAAEEAEGWTP